MSDEEIFEYGEQARLNTRALEYVSKSATLAQAFRLEPGLYDLVRRVNAIVVLENRDQAYIQFKREMMRLVGHEAARPELQTSRHYEAMLSLITLLLSWHTEQPPSIKVEEEEADEEMSVEAAVRRTMEASRLASLQAFRPLVEQHQQRDHVKEIR